MISTLIVFIIVFIRGQKTLKAAIDADSSNPYMGRPSSSRAASAATHQLDKAMEELDSEQHMPEGLDPTVWIRFIDVRRNKLDSEQKVRQREKPAMSMRVICMCDMLLGAVYMGRWCSHSDPGS